jgi:two-component system, LuxR family, sensor kinase FixL
MSSDHLSASNPAGRPSGNGAPCAFEADQGSSPTEASDPSQGHQWLEGREALNRAILEAAVDAIICIDDHGIIESINPATERIFGYSEGELLGKNVSMLMPNPYSQEHDSYLANYIRTGVKKIIGIGREVIGRRKDGTLFPADLAVGEIMQPGRRAFTGIIRDISDRKQAFESFRKEQEFAEAIIDTAQAIVLVLDVNSCIVRFNRFMEELSGVRLAEVKGQAWMDLFLPPHVLQKNPRPLRRALDDPIKGATYPITCRDGTERQIAWWATSMHDASGAVSGILAIGHDMTDLIDANQKLVQSERLAALGEAATRLAHESRNTLQRIQVAAGIARLGVEDRPQVQKQLDVIERSSEEIGELLVEVRNFAAPINLDKMPSDLAGLWQEAWNTLDSIRTGRAIKLREANSLSSKCSVDRFRIVQVFRNLLENSLAACSDPVEIEISAIELQRGGRQAEVRIRDNGPGLKPELRERVFEPFFTTKSKGTGLGMAIVRRIVEAHGGRVYVGDCTQGAEFVIHLPL